MLWYTQTRRSGARWIKREAAEPIEKWKRQTVSLDETCSYSHSGRARRAMRGWMPSAKMSDSKPAARKWRWMASASFEMASPYESAARSWWTCRAGARSALARRLRQRALLRQQLFQRLLPPGLQGQLALQLQHPVAQVLVLEAHARGLLGQVVQDVHQRLVEVGLARQGRDHGHRVPEQLLHRAQPAPRRFQEAADGAAAAAVDGLGVERVVPQLRVLQQLLQQAAAELVGVQHRVQAMAGQALDLLVGVEAARLLLGDALPDGAHHLFHVHAAGLGLECHGAARPQRPKGAGAPEAVYTMITMVIAHSATATSSGRSVRSTSDGLPPFSLRCTRYR